jgi:hypothetical protein
MAAAPFKVTMVLKNSAGQTTSRYLTASDVNAAALVYLSGGTEIPLSSQDCWITDMILSASGTDTSNMTIYINGVDSTGVRSVNTANLYTGFSRQFQSSPLKIPAGATVKITQNT